MFPSTGYTFCGGFYPPQNRQMNCGEIMKNLGICARRSATHLADVSSLADRLQIKWPDFHSKHFSLYPLVEPAFRREAAGGHDRLVKVGKLDVLRRRLPLQLRLLLPNDGQDRNKDREAVDKLS